MTSENHCNSAVFELSGLLKRPPLQCHKTRNNHASGSAKLSRSSSDTCSSFLQNNTPSLSLRWLPVCFRIKLKICLVTYKALCNNQPIYLKDMLKPPNRTRDLRSSEQSVLLVPRIRTKKGEWSFSVAVPKMWNRLPGEIRTLKTVQSFRKCFFRPSSFVSWHAQLVTRNGIPTTILNSPADCRAYELGTLRG